MKLFQNPDSTKIDVKVKDDNNTTTSRKLAAFNEKSLYITDVFSDKERASLLENSRIDNLAQNTSIVESDGFNTASLGNELFSGDRRSFYNPYSGAFEGLQTSIEEARANSRRDDSNSQGSTVFLSGIPFLGAIRDEGIDLIETEIKPSNLSKIISKTIDRKKNSNISIFSHELVRFTKNSKNEVDSNLLFLNYEDFNNDTIYKLKSSLLDKAESISDRFFIHVDYKIHDLELRKTFLKSQRLYQSLHDITKYSSNIKTELNFANVVNDFIISGSSDYIGKIFNTSIKVDESILNKIETVDKSYLDEQNKNEKSNIDLSSLNIYYELMSGFKTYDFNLEEGRLSFPVLNSDKLVAQLGINNTLADYFLYPNSDNPFNTLLKNRREKSNSSALNRYPLIQCHNLNLSSRIFLEGTDISSVNMKTFNMSNVLSKFSNNDLTSYLSQSILSNDEKNIFRTYNNEIKSSYAKRKSYLGKSRSSQRLSINSLNFYNNIFNITFSSEELNKNFYESIVFDVDTRTIFYTSPTFTQLPFRIIKNTYSGPEENISGYDLLKHDFDQNNTNISNVFYKSFGVDKNLLSDESFIDGPLSSGIRIFLEGEGNENKFNLIQSIIGKFFRSVFSKTIVRRYVDSGKKYLDLNYLEQNVSSDDNKYHNINFNLLQNTESLGELVFLPLGSTSGSADFDEVLNGYFNNTTQSIELTPEARTTITTRFNQVIDEIKINDNWSNDCIVVKTSNSLLTKSELNHFSMRKGVIKGKSKNKEIKTFNNRWINKDNINNNLLELGLYSHKNFTKNTLKISSAIRIAKNKLSPQVPYFSDILQKSREKSTKDNEFFLLYDESEENCIDTFDESPFIDKDSKSYKNNYCNHFNEKISNSTKRFYSIDEINNKHIILSKNYRSILTKRYPKSFLKNKKSLFLKVVKETIKIYEDNAYSKDEYFGFDVLMAKSLYDKNGVSKNDKKEIVKLIFKNALLKASGVDDQLSFLKKETIKQTNNFFEFDTDVSFSNDYLLNKTLKETFGNENVSKAVASIFSLERIKEINNFVLRLLEKNNDFEIEDLSVSGERSSVNFKTIPGVLCSLKFPFKVKKIKYDNSSLDNTLTNFKDFLSSYSDGEAGDLMQRANRYLMNLIDVLFNVAMYNHDIFLEEGMTGINFYESIEEQEENGRKKNIVVEKGFNFNLDAINRGVSLGLNYFDFDFENLNLKTRITEFLSSISMTDEISEDQLLAQEKFINDFSTEYSGIVRNNNYLYCPYSTNNKDFVRIPFSYFYLSNIDNTFSNSLTNLALDVIRIFEIDTSSFNNTDDINNYVSSNSFYVRLLEDIFSTSGKLFSETYDTLNSILVEEIKTSLIENGSRYFEQINSVYSITDSNNKKFRLIAIEELKRLYEENISNEVAKIKNVYNSPEFDFQQFKDSERPEGIFTGSMIENQRILNVLNNSDIAEALSHDIIHAYFKLFEDNIEKLNETREQFSNIISDISSEIDLIENNGLDNFGELISNEFYQNKISKDLQEVMFYKKVFNESFVENELFNSLEEKYKNANIFNHRKLEILNKYNIAKKSVQLLSRNFNEFSDEKVDIIRLPISYNFVNKIGNKGLLEVSILPVNLKFPEIEYKEIKKYYTPMLTDITSNFASVIDVSDGEFIGVYEDSQKFSERYGLISRQEADIELTNIVYDVLVRKSEMLGQDLSQVIFEIVDRLYNNAVDSSAIKALGFITQQNLDENIKTSDIDVDGLVSGKTLALFNSIDIDRLAKIFENYDKDIDDIAESEGYFSLSNSEEVLDKDLFYRKFLNEIDKDMSVIDIAKTLLPTNNYDMFSMMINRKEFEIVSKTEVLGELYKVSIAPDESDKAFVYYIGVKVL